MYGARIVARANLQIFATPVLGNRARNNFRKSAYLLRQELRIRYENKDPGGR